jgi:3-deoxy-D-manno-octulosonate 8-phosphate phosphatase (KDO 8-P phosphatase)
MPERDPERPQTTPGESIGPSVAESGVPVQKQESGSILQPSPTPEASALADLIEGPVKGPVRIIFLDVDGTLTDGIIGHDPEADFRHFWVRDGIALQWARDLGVLSVVISGRRSKAVVARMEDLNLEYYEGIRDKVAVAQKVLDREGVKWEHCVMVGDDLPDIALMKKVAWPIAVANAQPEVKLIAKTVLGTYGGQGAVREMVEMVLRHNGTWDQVLQWYDVP